MTRLILGLLVVVAVAGPVLAADQPAADQPVEVGRIYVIDGNKSYMIAEFPSGRRVIDVDRRNLWRYRVGDEIRVDSFGRIQS